MSEHSEMVEGARGLADRLAYGRVQAPMVTANTLRALADIVEAQDKQQPVFDELLAASRTCVEVIKEYLDTPAHVSGPGTQTWTKLRAAHHLVKRAVELADKLKGGA